MNSVEEKRDWQRNGRERNRDNGKEGKLYISL